MFDWVYHNREEFLVNYVEIGHTYQVSKDHQEAHSQFTVACQVRWTHHSCFSPELLDLSACGYYTHFYIQTSHTYTTAYIRV